MNKESESSVQLAGDSGTTPEQHCSTKAKINDAVIVPPPDAQAVFPLLLQAMMLSIQLMRIEHVITHEEGQDDGKAFAESDDDWMATITPQLEILYGPFDKNDKHYQNVIQRMKGVFLQRKIWIVEKEIKLTDLLLKYKEFPPSPEFDDIFRHLESIRTRLQKAYHDQVDSIVQKRKARLDAKNKILDLKVRGDNNVD